MRKVLIVLIVSAFAGCNSGSSDTAIDKVRETASSVKDSAAGVVKPVIEKVDSTIDAGKDSLIKRKNEK